MDVQLLPSACGGQHAGPQFLSSYLVGDAVVVDAGAIGLQADLELQQLVRHVFLTHAHIDHVASLPLLLENTYEPGPDRVEVLAGAETLAKATTLAPLQAVERAVCRVTPVPISHGCETLAMVVDDGDSCVAFAADTGPTEQLWRELAARPTLRGVFLECSFPNALRDLATRTGHLCPATFAARRARLPPDVRVFAVHRKARYAEAIARELAECGGPRVELVRPGEVYRV